MARRCSNCRNHGRLPFQVGIKRDYELDDMGAQVRWEGCISRRFKALLAVYSDLGPLSCFCIEIPGCYINMIAHLHVQQRYIAILESLHLCTTELFLYRM